jgi:hypothetical protein
MTKFARLFVYQTNFTIISEDILIKIHAFAYLTWGNYRTLREGKLRLKVEAIFLQNQFLHLLLRGINEEV